MSIYVPLVKQLLPNRLPFCFACVCVYCAFLCLYSLASMLFLFFFGADVFALFIPSRSRERSTCRHSTFRNSRSVFKVVGVCCEAAHALAKQVPRLCGILFPRPRLETIAEYMYPQVSVSARLRHYAVLSIRRTSRKCIFLCAFSLFFRY